MSTKNNFFPLVGILMFDITLFLYFVLNNTGVNRCAHSPGTWSERGGFYTFFLRLSICHFEEFHVRRTWQVRRTF